MRGLDAHFLEVLILHHNITTPLVFEAFYDLVGWTFFRVRFRDLFVSDRTEIAGTKLPETKLLLSRGGINRHWNVNQPKADAAFPDRTPTGECFPIALGLSTLTSPPPVGSSASLKFLATRRNGLMFAVEMSLLASFMNLAGPDLIVILLIILVLFGAKK